VLGKADSTSHMVPTQFHRLLALPEDVRARYDVSSLRCMVHAAAPCPPDVKRRMIEWWGDAIMEYYAPRRKAAARSSEPRSG
jgi:long-chain acyl-CoA synthetase